jgi:hypothetical protein
VAKTIVDTSDTARQGSVVALAGRRVDAPNVRPIRFPPRNARLVEDEIREFFQKGVRVLVCSAACGADLLALGVAGELGIRRRIILPYARALFRETSVVDRPGDWGERYDRILNEVERQAEVVILDCKQSDPDAYARTNAAIVDEALQIAQQEGTVAQALIVWNGKSRGSTDLTSQFVDHAREKGMPILEVLTLTIRPKPGGVAERRRLGH